MRHVVRRGLAAGAGLVIVGTSVLVGVGGTAGASGPPTLEQAGIATAESLAGGVTLSVVGSPSPVTDTTVPTLADGQVAATEQSFELTGGSTLYAVGVTDLGGVQDVVSVVTAATGDGTLVVLQPDGTAFASTDPIVASGAGVGPLAAGGCSGTADAPTVIGSVYGPLIDGLSSVSCSSSESLAVISSLYQTSPTNMEVGNTGSGSATTTYLAENAYAPCTSNSTGADFQTAELWSDNGTLQAGVDSAVAWLACEAF